MAKRKSNRQLRKEIKNLKLQVELEELKKQLREASNSKPKPEMGFHV